MNVPNSARLTRGTKARHGSLTSDVLGDRTVAENRDKRTLYE